MFSKDELEGLRRAIAFTFQEGGIRSPEAARGFIALDAKLQAEIEKLEKREEPKP